VSSAAPAPALRMTGVGLTRDGRDLLDDVDWCIEAGHSWVVLGANGSGKTTLVRIAALYEHPSRGTVEVLGETLGHTDVRSLRRRVALVSPAMVDLMRPALSTTDVVMCAKYAALEPWWHTYDDADRDRARELLVAQGVGHVVDRPFGTLSSGERQRTLLARALMPEPGLVLLDEPTSGLDLRGREELVDRLDALARDRGAPPMVLVTHHVEEIPPAFTDLLALAAGRVVARGPLADTLDAGVLGRTFGMDLAVDRVGGRWTARRA
jgi:iron complex transport system ATP-binding protein